MRLLAASILLTALAALSTAQTIYTVGSNCYTDGCAGKLRSGTTVLHEGALPRGVSDHKWRGQGGNSKKNEKGTVNNTTQVALCVCFS